MAGCKRCSLKRRKKERENEEKRKGKRRKKLGTNGDQARSRTRDPSVRNHCASPPKNINMCKIKCHLYNRIDSFDFSLFLCIESLLPSAKVYLI